VQHQQRISDVRLKPQAHECSALGEVSGFVGMFFVGGMRECARKGMAALNARQQRYPQATGEVSGHGTAEILQRAQGSETAGRQSVVGFPGRYKGAFFLPVARTGAEPAG
jgi:hypothetical protein